MCAYFLRVGFILSSNVPFWNFLISVMLSGIPWLGCLVITRTFGLTRNQKTIRNLFYIGYACAVGMALVALASFFLYRMIFSRLLLLIGAGINLAVVSLWHGLFEQVHRALLRMSPPAFPTLIVGITRESRALLKQMRESRNPLTPVGVLDTYGSSEQTIEGVPLLGRLHKLPSSLFARRSSSATNSCRRPPTCLLQKRIQSCSKCWTTQEGT